MGYYLKGILTDGTISSKITDKYSEAKKINLCDELYLLPMTDELFDEINCFTKSQSIGRFELFNDQIKSLLIELSEYGYIAYIEAEYFGGQGGQSSVVFMDRSLVYFSEYSKNAINNTLKLFEVKRIRDLDEFDSVGLGRHRYVEDWVEE